MKSLQEVQSLILAGIRETYDLEDSLEEKVIVKIGESYIKNKELSEMFFEELNLSAIWQAATRVIELDKKQILFKNRFFK